YTTLLLPHPVTPATLTLSLHDALPTSPALRSLRRAPPAGLPAPFQQPHWRRRPSVPAPVQGPRATSPQHAGSRSRSTPARPIRRACARSSAASCRGGAAFVAHASEFVVGVPVG